MTDKDITYLIHDHLTTYSLMMNEHIKSKFYERALTDLAICKELLIMLKYIKEHEVKDNASIK
jgi:hypothetical protein|nr:MAG TPA_asm: hypothetical protein [Caudoviricetes sp.]